MGMDRRPERWGQPSPKISARLAPCKCGNHGVAGTDTAGMWSAECRGCGTQYLGDDMLGFETWHELVREWNAHQAK